MILPYQDQQRSQPLHDPGAICGGRAFFHAATGWLVRQKWKVKKASLLRKARQLAVKSEMWAQKEPEQLQQQVDLLWRRGSLPDKLTKQELEKRIIIVAALAGQTLGLSPYPEQIMATMIMYHGAIVEMATGEGKSLVAAMTAVLLAAENRPVQVLTANDYLAQRDAELMSPLFRALGLSVACVQVGNDSAQRRQAYAQTIVYTTAKELLGDYLRDRLYLGNQSGDVARALAHILSPDAANEGLLLRGLSAVVIDEVDNILVDEAVTPLILSTAHSNRWLEQAIIAAHNQSQVLQLQLHYRVDLSLRQIVWLSAADSALDSISQLLPPMWRGLERCRELFSFILQARELFHCHEHYVIQGERVVLIDAVTGRLTPQRNFGIGLQQAVEVKEGLPLSVPSETLARLSFQNFFRMLPHLSGMSGTVGEATAELWQIYRSSVVRLPTHCPVARKLLHWQFFVSQESKLQALVEDIYHVHKLGQPVLVGTRSVDMSEEIAQLCRQQGMVCQVLNALRHAEEAAIVAQAGQLGAITIATNMAGRGTDIRLGSGVVVLGGLYVICAEPQHSARLDRQLYGRACRQGDPGQGRTYACCDDLLYRRFVSSSRQRLWGWLWRGTFPWRHLLLRWQVRRLQQRSEALAAGQRQAIQAKDDWLNKNLIFPWQGKGGNDGENLS